MGLCITRNVITCDLFRSVYVRRELAILILNIDIGKGESVPPCRNSTNTGNVKINFKKRRKRRKARPSDPVAITRGIPRLDRERHQRDSFRRVRIERRVRENISLIAVANVPRIVVR